MTKYISMVRDKQINYLEESKRMNIAIDLIVNSYTSQVSIISVSSSEENAK
jgi:Iap family predicted aminopeptidase